MDGRQNFRTQYSIRRTKMVCLPSAMAIGCSNFAHRYRGVRWYICGNKMALAHSRHNSCDSRIVPNRVGRSFYAGNDPTPGSSNNTLYRSARLGVPPGSNSHQTSTATCCVLLRSILGAIRLPCSFIRRLDDLRFWDLSSWITPSNGSEAK